MPLRRLLVLALLATAPGAHAQTPVAVGGEFQVNSYTTGFQSFGYVATGPDGSFVVVWSSYGSFGSDADLSSIQGQLYASNGDPLGAQFQVNSLTTAYQAEPSVAMGPDGGFVVAWFSSFSDGSDSGLSIQGQRFASNGDLLGAQFQVNTYTTNSQLLPSVAVDSDGDFVVVWESRGSDNGDTSHYSVQGQLYASDGDPLGRQFRVNSYTTGAQGPPAVKALSAGSFVVVWGSDGSYQGDNLERCVDGQRFQVTAGIFTDGFESGSTSAWTGSIP